MYEEDFHSEMDNANVTSEIEEQPKKTEDEKRYYDYTTYQPEQSVFTTEESATSKKKKAKKEKSQRSSTKGSGIIRRGLVMAGCGILFGAFAGASFYGIMGATGVLDNITQYNKNAVSNNVTYNQQESQSGIKLINTDDVKVVASDVAAVVEEVMPAMVSIVNKYTVTGSFFGQQYQEQKQSRGSGIIVAQNDDELLIVTNYHVAAQATTLEITFIDETVANAQIKGVDSEMDLAVLAVQLEDLKAETLKNIAIAQMGDSDSLRLGEPVIAIGNALGYGQSVTNGIVSALNREITMSDGSTGTYIQTNAAINPGNSGGALLNINGQVIGINSSKIGGSAVEGMGYAIPISAATPIITELMERQTRREEVEESEAGYMGVTLQEVTSQISQTYKMPRGVFVYSMVQDCAAQKAGIIVGDVITKLEGERIQSYSELQDVLKYYAAGDVVQITIMRQENGEYVEHEYEMTLGKKTDSK